MKTVTIDIGDAARADVESRFGPSPAGIFCRVGESLGVPTSPDAAARGVGQHGTRPEADVRAAACWAIRKAYPGMSYRSIGLVVNLKPSSVRQAILRAPKVFKASELERFAGRKP